MSVVALLWRTEDYVFGFLDSLDHAARFANASVEVIAVVNGPEGDASAALLEKRRPRVDALDIRIVSAADNLGFAGGVNLGLCSATGDLLVVANLDLVFAPDFISELLRAAGSLDSPSFLAPSVVAHPDATAPSVQRATHLEDTGPLRRDRLHRPAVIRPLPQVGGKVEAASGSCLVLGRPTYDLRCAAVGGLFDSEYHSYWEDVDLFWWANRAWIPVWFDPHLRVVHYQGGSNKGKFRFVDRTADVQKSIMANYRITVWKNARRIEEVLFWVLGEAGYLIRSVQAQGVNGISIYMASWMLAVQRARAIASRRGALRPR